MGLYKEIIEARIRGLESEELYIGEDRTLELVSMLMKDIRILKDPKVQSILIRELLKYTRGR